jgi:hypothetical protein
VTTPQPSRHAAVERQFLVDLHATRLVDDRVLRERAEQAHQAEVVAAAGVVASSAVGDLHSGREGLTAHVAEVRVAGRTARAASARRDESEDHVVAGLETGDVGTHFHHDAGALVTADQRHGRRGAREIAGDEVFVGVAHARCLHLDEHFAGLGRVEFDGLDAPLLADLPEDCCLCLHESKSRSATQTVVHRTD